MQTLDTGEARRYLEKVAPVCENGYVTIHRLESGSLPGNAHKTIDTALKDLDYWVRKGVDTYLCLGATSSIKHTANGPYPKADRKGSKLIGTKAIWLDIDVKDGGYNSTLNAQKALARFIKDASLLLPTLIVESGSGGMHVYWTCDRMITPLEFDALATALIKVAKKHKLLFDAGCTKDRVRVLRPPGTYNFKGGKVRLVKTYHHSLINYTFEQLRDMLGEVTIVSEPIDQPKLDYPPTDIDQVATVCPFLKTTLDTGGKGYSEPLWTLTVMLATYCADPEETAKRLSKGHEKYLEEETLDKLRYHIEDHKSNTKVGPPKCGTFHTNGATECNTCPMLAHNRSPLNLPGASVSGSFQPTNSDDLPDGYFRGSDNRIYGNISKKQPDGTYAKETVKVFPYPIVYKSAWVEPNCADYHMNFITHEEGNKERNIILPYSLTSSEDGFKRTLAAAGIVLPRYQRETREFMLAFQEMLRSRAGGMVRDEPVGWTMKNGEFEGFSFDGQYYSPNEQHVVPKLKGALLQNYTPMGSIQPLLEVCNIITSENRPANEIILLSGLAAPLVPMTGHSGIIIGCYSPESGIGKSTAMEASTAIWGHPINSRCSLNDTVNMAINKAGQIKHLPLNWDEVKTKQQFANLSNIIFQMTEGREKGRLNRSSEAKDMKDFQTLLTYNSNASVLDEVSNITKGTSAGQLRDFEFRVPTYQFKSSRTTVEVQNLVHQLKTNHGMLGIEYAKYLGQNGRTVHKEVTALQTKLEHMFNVGREERFWIAAMTVILSAAKIAKSQNWIDTDTIALYKFLEKEFLRMRGKKEKSPTDYTQEKAILWLLAEYVSANRTNNMVIVNKLWVGAGRPPLGSVEMEGKGTSKEAQLRQINVVVGRENKMIRFTDSSFLHFCRDRDVPVGAARSGLRDMLGATLVNARITAGLGFPCVGEPCWLLRLEGTPYENNFEI